MFNKKAKFNKTNDINEALHTLEEFVQTIPCLTSEDEGNSIAGEVKRITELIQEKDDVDAITKRLRRVLIIASIKMHIISLERIGSEIPGYGTINSEMDVFNLVIAGAFKYGPVAEVVSVLFEQLSYNNDTDNLLTKLIILHAPDPTEALNTIALYIDKHQGVAEAIKELHEQVNSDDMAH